jgi:26S proteasome regulatory subunit N7
MEKKDKKNYTASEIEAKLKEFDDKIKEAKETQGEIEVRDHTFDKAIFLKDDIKDFEKAEIVLREVYEIASGASKKMEVLFEILQINFHRMDVDAVKKDVDKCKQHVEEGGDWEKKNKLKVYEGVYCMMIRNFKRAAELFIDSISTFTCSEMFSYTQFVFYTVVTSMVSLDRGTLRTNVVHSPDILQVIREIPNLKKFSDSFYHCQYR